MIETRITQARAAVNRSALAKRLRDLAEALADQADLQASAEDGPDGSVVRFTSPGLYPCAG
jgi:hypothetical protein